MLDTLTQQPLKVDPARRGGGIIDVPAVQAKTLLEALQARGVRCWITGGFITIDGRPPRGYVALSANEDAGRVQAVLDSIT